MQIKVLNPLLSNKELFQKTKKSNKEVDSWAGLQRTAPDLFENENKSCAERQRTARNKNKIIQLCCKGLLHIDFKIQMFLVPSNEGLLHIHLNTFKFLKD